MKFKLLTLVLLAALFAALAVACDDDEENGDDEEETAKPTEAAGFPLTFTDDSGAEVTLEAEPERIVALAPSFVEVLFEVGAGEQIVAADENTDYPPEAESIPKLSGFDPSVEAIVETDPDVVLIQFDPGTLTDSLTQSGIPVATLGSPADIDGVYKQIETIGLLSGHGEEAEALVSEMQSELADVVAEIPTDAHAPTVFHEVDNTLFSVGPGSFIHDIYVVLLAENIAEATGEAYPQLNNEAVIAANPEVIILADEKFGETPETVAARPGWDAIAAVQSGRIHGVDPDLISRPGPRLPETIQQISEYLYPES
jgi:iron complex transport system substrate-binding protein